MNADDQHDDATRGPADSSPNLGGSTQNSDDVEVALEDLRRTADVLNGLGLRTLSLSLLAILATALGYAWKFGSEIAGFSLFQNATPLVGALLALASIVQTYRFDRLRRAGWGLYEELSNELQQRLRKAVSSDDAGEYSPPLRFRRGMSEFERNSRFPFGPLAMGYFMLLNVSAFVAGIVCYALPNL